MQVTSSSFQDELSYGNSAIALSEIISALTFALDLTEGAVPGHSLRSCLIGMRLGSAIGLPSAWMTELYYALLLKDVGCSSNAARLCAIVGGGDERVIKAGSKLGDYKSPKMWRMLWNNVLPEGNAFQRVARIMKMGAEREKNNKEIYSLRCDRGASILRKLELGNRAADAVFHLDEFWDGSGYPFHLEGGDIPILSRICSVAQNLDAFASEVGKDGALAVLKQRSETWFDPKLVDLAHSLHKFNDLWEYCGPGSDAEETRAAVMDLDSGERAPLTPERLDNICEAFSSVVDAKSPFTYRHSIGVAETSSALAKELGFSEDRSHMIRRAALLHDVGKLRVPNSILDKNGKPTDEEWAIIREHPTVSRNILRRVGAFRELAVVAAEHHEKLDGSGYPDHLVAEQMSPNARLIAVADIYSALAEERPYRGPLDPREVLNIIKRDVPTKLDATSFEAMTAIVERGDWDLQQVVTASMSQNTYGVGAMSTCPLTPIGETVALEEIAAA
jgi:putative nucleotidyltransferase with HDIG domain